MYGSHTNIFFVKFLFFVFFWKCSHHHAQIFADAKDSTRMPGESFQLHDVAVGSFALLGELLGAQFESTALLAAVCV